MAKEMVIIFVYDTQLLKKEEDDPSSAILYFHPHWVSDQQRTALCGQIMGTVHCLKSVFNCPRIVSLQSGKFSLIEYGRYVLTVGTDRNIPNWVLQYRTDLLTSLISFYHHDIQTISELYETNSKLSNKLYHMFETYLKMLIYGGNMFSNIATIQFPKSANTVFLEAIQILQSLQELEHVLGGTLFYHNKVVATQLSAKLTKHLILTDPYRIKSPAEAVSTYFQLPLGVQLLHVYLDNKQFVILQKDAARCKRKCENVIQKEDKKDGFKAQASREPTLSAMKRDQSLIFTTVPEEDPEHHSPVNITTAFVSTRSKSRPKFLNLRSKTTDETSYSRVDSDSTHNISFCGPTSVCSTPLTDIKRVVLPGTMSICTDPNKEESKCSNDIVTDEINESLKTESVNSILSAAEDKSHTSLHSIPCTEKLLNSVPYVHVGVSLYDKKRFSSMFEIREKLKCLSKRITMRYYNKSPRNLNGTLVAELEESPKKDLKKNFQTITDPTFPVFRNDGKVISKSFYEAYIKTHLSLVNFELNRSKDGISENNTDEWKSVEDFDMCFRDVSKKQFVVNEIEMVPLKKQQENDAKPKPRKSLTLPLKSLSSDPTESLLTHCKKKERFSGGVQLTPLMTKLSMLAVEELSSGFGSKDTTPSEYKDLYTPSQPNFPFLRKCNADSVEAVKRLEHENKLQKCIMFVCGQQDMVVNVLLEESALSSSDVINKLWEVSTEHLGKLERQLRHCLETYPGNVTQNEGETYSYLFMDSEWDTVQRGGPWGAAELGALTHLHRDFMGARNLMEMILRYDDGVIYGHHCSKKEVFYHQSAATNAGLPTPSDPMGAVPQKAKRRLERDHAIMLL